MKRHLKIFFDKLLDSFNVAYYLSHIDLSRLFLGPKTMEKSGLRVGSPILQGARAATPQF